ncbi:MAG: TonB-dependent receptor [Bacteroidetes bacterium]|nr:TonB-dependent receptor [Bacteroidota bacterium]
MKRALLFCLFLLSNALSGQNDQYTISGYVREASSGEELIGVNVVIKELQTGTTTNNYGYYSISLPPGKYTLSIQYIGFQTIEKELSLSQDLKLNLELKENSTQLDEVVVKSERIDQNVSSVEMSVAQLDVKDVKKMPALLGEVDIIRTLTLLPGISTVGEASNGFNVRGGNSDQNLILLDEAPIYNSSHLFGFFSIFNADAVKDVKLYKGGIPAQYGGRLSSVVDVRQKDGNNREFSGTGGIGLLSSRLLLEGPIVKEKSAFMFAGRRSYADIFLGLSPDEAISQNTLFFYDFNGKINYILGDNDRLYLSGYYGRDVFEINDLFGFEWGNATTSLRWNHLFNDKLFSNFTAIFSDYTYQLGTPEDDAFNFRLESTIQDYHFKNQYTWYASSKSQFDFGIEGIYYRFKPGTISGSIELELQEEFALEPSLYFSHEYKFSPLLTVQYGVRYSSFYNLGSQTKNIYQNQELPDLGEIQETVNFESGEIIKAYNGLEGLEPRLAVNYRLDDEKSIKLSYNRTRQYIHLISNTTAPTPVDLYRPAGMHIKPATVNQIAGGYFQNFLNNQYELSLESYYKDFRNIVDYRNGAELIFNETIETEILAGIGRSYGLEVYLRKQEGKLTGWVSYTLSKTELKVDGVSPSLAINAGEWYPANYDKRHDISVVLNYKLTSKWDIGMNFTYQTGRPITPPEGKFQIEDYVVPIYRERNSYRIPDYHRLDLSANYTPPKVEGKKFYSSWSIGIYNVYGRRNAYSIYFEQQDNPEGAISTNLNTQAVQLSIFGTIIPSVTWNFNF